MKVTISDIINNKSYPVEPGRTQYEVAPGVAVTLRYPYGETLDAYDARYRDMERLKAERQAAQKAARERGETPDEADAITEAEDDAFAIEVAQIVTEGAWPERVMKPVVVRIALDFFYAAHGTTRPQAQSSQELMSTLQRLLMSTPPNGRGRGDDVPADGPTSSTR